MNIFYLDSDPKKSAEMHNDRHVVKMILESAQLLSTAHRVIDNIEDDSTLYKKTHTNHPSAKWVRESSQHYDWLYNLFVELCKEYKYRYNKTHLTERKLKDVLSKKPKNLTDKGFRQPPQAMPDYLRSSDSISAYRNYYQREKSHLAKWTKRNPPKWYSL